MTDTLPPVYGAPPPGKRARSTPLWVMSGGVRQFVALRGRGRVPVLVVHGGPGASLLPFAREIAGTTRLEDDFALAYWEQRGTGRSRGRLREHDLTLDGIVADCVAVAEALRDRFGRPPVLVGHSWGSAVGLLAAVRRPDLFAAVLGVGQVVCVAEGERLSYDWAFEQAQQAGDKAGLRELRRIGPPPHDHRGMLRERAVLARHGGVWRGHGTWALAAGDVWRALRTPEYTLRDLVRQAADPFFSLRVLVEEKYTVDLFVQAPRVEVPAHFIAGAHDWTTPSVLVERYVAAFDAPRGKRLIRFENSAHLPFLEEPAAFEAVVREVAGMA